MEEVTEEAIEEGRIALIQLEQELKEKTNDATSVGSNRHHSSTGDERRLLDQTSRVTRLNNRLESLGLTVEELDDRGLLDGGGSVPSYYTSMKNKNRRTLELQSRSNRLQGRGKETFTKLLNSFLHMMRTLVRKGLRLDHYCRSHDPNRRGLMRKKSFVSMLKAVGLPLSLRELQEITLHYVVPGSDQADYVTLLKDLHIVNLDELDGNLFENTHQLLDLASPALQDIPEGENGAELSQKVTADGNGDRDTSNDGSPDAATTPNAKKGTTNDLHEDVGTFTTVLADVKRMLLDSIRSLNKDQDEVYRMFARWDTNGSGTVTATQFLRVLARLHVNLSDQDQDFLVELLDTSAMGRIDFEGLLSFCFTPSSPTGAEAPEVLSPVAMSGGGSLSMGDWADGGGNETMSAVSTDNNSVDLKSMNSHALSSGVAHNRGRPRTATLSRPYNELNVYNAAGSHVVGSAHARGSLPFGTAPAQPSHAQYYHAQYPPDEYYRNAPNKGTAARLQRPMTASARVSTQPTTPNSSNGHGSAGRFADVEGDGHAQNGGRFAKAQSMVPEYSSNDAPSLGNNRDGGRPAKAAPAPANAVATTPPTLPRVGPHAPLPRDPTAPLQQPHASAAAGGGGGLSAKQLSFRNVDAEDSQFVAELPDDVMYGEEKYLGADSARGNHKATTGVSIGGKHAAASVPQKQSRAQMANQAYFGGQQGIAGYHDRPHGDADRQDDYYYGAPRELPQLPMSRQPSGGNAPQGGGGPVQGHGDGGHGNTVTWAMQTNGNGNTSPEARWVSRDGVPQQYQQSYQLSFQQQPRGAGAPPVMAAWREARDPNASQYPSGPDSHSAHAAAAQLLGQSNMYAPHPQHNLASNADNYGRPTASVGSYANAGYVPEPSSPAAKDPMDHLVLLANQILTTLREIIMTRYRKGSSLQEIFQHFDRDDKSYFDARDFIIATSDLRIETSPRVAAIAVNLIALDGYDKVSFGEFKVFVLDSDHKLLELNVQEQLAQLLEQKGREYQSFMVDMFWSEEESLNDSRTAMNRQNNNEFVSKSAFISSLQRVGLVLTSSEVSRLVDRFDVYGNDMCSVLRFVRMVQNSRAWRHGERVLAYQDEAIEEAEYLRQQLRAAAEGRSGDAAHLPDLSEELISMCEYLGIRVLSEPNMVWIAADALKAPLPISWTAQRDPSGRTYFYNHLTNQAKLEHPLDPHFRKLRDRYRQGGSAEADGDSGINLQTTFTATSSNLPNNAPSKNPNSQISFGGAGAALNPAPVAHSLNLQPRPQPPQDQLMQHLYPHSGAQQPPQQSLYHQPSGGAGGYQNASLQPAQSTQDERGYAQYMLSSGAASPSAPGRGGMGGQQVRPTTATADRSSSSALNAGTRPGRRPQSALDRMPQTAIQPPSHQQHQQQQYTGPPSSAAGAGRNAVAAAAAANAASANSSSSNLLAGISTGLYSAELKGLMGSAAYNRPLSAPNKHHVETLQAYTDATQKMREKEERIKHTMEKLEAVYLENQTMPDGTAVHVPKSRLHQAGRPQSAVGYGHTQPSSGGPTQRWSAATATAPSMGAGMSAVDRALAIGRTNSGLFGPAPAAVNLGGYGALQPSAERGQYNQPTGGRPRSSDRARSAPRGSAGHHSSNNLANTLGRALPLDHHAKQQLLSEMFDDALLDKLDSAIGMGRR